MDVTASVVDFLSLKIAYCLVENVVISARSGVAPIGRGSSAAACVHMS